MTLDAVRLDASMLSLQPDMYQAMAVAALQGMRGVDPSKQSQNLLGRSVAMMQSQMVQQYQPQQIFLQGVPDNHHSVQSQPQTQSHLLQQQLQHHHSFSNS